MLPRGAPQDPGDRRLRSGRYAADVLLGFTGPRAEAVAIQPQLGNCLRAPRQLTLSEETTLSTHGRTEAARVRGYDRLVFQADHKRDKAGRRVIHGTIGLRVPRDVVPANSQPYKRHGQPRHRAEMAHDPVFSIVAHDQQRSRGLVEYYRMADNLIAWDERHRVVEQPLTMTRAKGGQRKRIRLPETSPVAYPTITKATQEKNAENLLIIRDPALAAQYTQHWEAYRQRRQPYVGRGIRE
jgi:hypothetical protein